MVLPTIKTDILRRQIAVQQLWTHNLRDAAIKGRTGGLCPEIVGDDTLCSFGKWLISDEAISVIQDNHKHRQIIDLHKDFHSCAAEMIRLIESR